MSNARRPRLEAAVRAEPRAPFWTFPLAAFALSRVAIGALNHWGLKIEPALHRGGSIDDLRALRGLCWWDCNWYRAIGVEGYTSPERAAFFPLFPLLSKAVAYVTTLEMPFAMLLVSNLAALGAYLCIFRIFSALRGDAAARIGLTLLVTWPFSFIHAAAYPESLMLLSTSAAVLLAQRGRHFSAGLVLGLGTLARHLTLIAGLSLLAAQLRERGRHPARLLALLVPFLVAGSYAVYCHFHYGNAWLWWTARGTYWGELAWTGLPTFFEHDQWEPKIAAYVALSLIPAAGALALLRRRDTWVLAAFAVGLMAVVYAIGLAALGRYSASCWPAFLPLASWLSKRPGYEGPVIGAFALLQGLFLYLYSHSYTIN